MPVTTRGRRRSFDADKKADFRELVQQGASLEEAAHALEVSLRTVQRERRLDKDFDRQLRLAQRAAVDPLTLLQQAARTHWRAAAWLLERTDPEQYARRRPHSASPNQVTTALHAVIEAALTATPLETRGELYDRVQAAAGNALRSIFPEHRPGEQHNAVPLTPLVEHERFKRRADSAPHLQLFDDDDLTETPTALVPTPASSPLKMGLTSPAGAKNLENLESSERASPVFQQADNASRLAPLDAQESHARRAEIARRTLDRLQRVKRSLEAELNACSAQPAQNRDAIDAAPQHVEGCQRHPASEKPAECHWHPASEKPAECHWHPASEKPAGCHWHPASERRVHAQRPQHPAAKPPALDPGASPNGLLKNGTGSGTDAKTFEDLACRQRACPTFQQATNNSSDQRAASPTASFPQPSIPSASSNEFCRLKHALRQNSTIAAKPPIDKPGADPPGQPPGASPSADPPSELTFLPPGADYNEVLQPALAAPGGELVSTG